MTTMNNSDLSIGTESQYSTASNQQEGGGVLSFLFGDDGKYATKLALCAFTDGKPLVAHYIINNALSNSPDFFSVPLVIKNPYNNVPFNKSTLYNIYFNIMSKTYIVSELIHKFFLTNFDINKFD